LLYKLSFPQPIQTRGRQNYRIVLAGFQLAQACIHISAQRINLKVGPERLELGLPAQAACPYACALRQAVDARVLARTKHVAGILAFGNCSNFESRRDICGQVF
jgi:hypothetical protein